MRYWIFIVFFQLLMLNFTQAQTYTIIPDANFEQALIDLGIDSGNIDGQVLSDTIASVTDLNIINKNILDLTGIQGFTKLNSLNCAFNQLTNIDISQNTDLITLDISSNQLTNINTSSNNRLKKLYCSSNKLSSIDILNNDSLLELDCSNNQLSAISTVNNPFLAKLICSNNKLDTIDLSANADLYLLNLTNNRFNTLNISNLTKLKTFFCSTNLLKNIDISTNDSLDFFDCSNNQISSLDLSNLILISNLNASANQISSINISTNDSLKTLDFSNNQLNTIDLSQNLILNTLTISSNQLQSINLSQNLKIESLNLSQNLIETLDLSKNTELSSVTCTDNQLKSIDIQNSNNQNITKFDVTNNNDFLCILVDNASDANSNANWIKDSSAKFSESCISYTYVPDNNFETALSAYDDISDDNYVPTANIISLNYLNLANLSIANLTGIEDFINLDSLDCSNNNISNLDMSFQPKLIKLKCDTNELYSLILKNNTSSLLTQVDARGNPLLSCIQVDDTTKAKNESNWLIDSTSNYSVDCTVNKTYIPDFRFEQALIDLGYDKGSIDQYVFTDSINTLKILDVSKKNIYDLTGISDFISLDSLDCSENNIDTLIIDSLKNLKNLSCFSNYLKELNTTQNTKLQKLNCGNNFLNTIDISTDTLLTELYCDNNNLENIDLSLNPLLEVLNINSNFLTINGLNLNSNLLLKKVFCSANNLTEIDVSYNKALEVLDCSNNKISVLNTDSTSNLVKLDCSINNLSSLNLNLDSLIETLNFSSNLLTSIDLTKNTKLRNLYLANNQIPTIDISKNDSLRIISASNNQLGVLNTDNNPFLNNINISDNNLNSLNLINNDSLQILWCNNNQITELVVDSSKILVELICENNKIDSLNFTQNDSLIKLYCSNNNISEINLNPLTKLKFLSINNNQLSDLNTNNNTLLENISCADNKISILDFSNNTNLNSISCNTNELSSLIIKNGNNSQLNSFNASNNPQLYCIEIDDENNINSEWQKDAQASFSQFCHYNESYIPDDNFEASLSLLIGEASNNNDNYIATDSLSQLISLDISNKAISDLTGIQDFTALETLLIQNNTIDTLDLSQNKNLKVLNCANNLIDSLDFSQNTLLQNIDFSNNQVNEFSPQLLVNLENLNCSANNLISLDLSLNTKLVSLDASSNNLTSFSINNGNNANLIGFNSLSNTNLTCIEVDNAANANSGTGIYLNWQKDASASFTENCHYNQSYIPDNAFEQSLIDQGYDNTGLDNYVPTEKINKISYLNIRNNAIADLTGIEDFSELITLNCSSNNIDSINLNANQKLVNLDCSSNQLSKLEISADTILQTLNVSNNLLTQLDISKNIYLQEITASSNQISNLSIINNTALTYVDFSSNQLYSVDANNGLNSQLTKFDLRNNPDLRCILIDDINASLSYSGWYKDETAGYKLFCDDDDNDGIPDDEDLCPNTPFGDFVNIFGCTIFRLPTDNFTLTTYSETCKDGNNGILIIAANEILNYTATLYGSIDTITQIFTDIIEIKNLRAGTYNLSIKVENETDYEQWFQVKITEPEDLSVYTIINKTDNSIQLKMAGAIKYYISLNGKEWSTTQNTLSLGLKKGENRIQIRTENECQGTFEKKIFISENPVIYPNPVKNEINIFIGQNLNTNVQAQIFSATGKLISYSNYSVNDGLLLISTIDLKPGLYYISIKSKEYNSNFKVLKN